MESRLLELHTGVGFTWCIAERLLRKLGKEKGNQ